MVEPLPIASVTSVPEETRLQEFHVAANDSFANRLAYFATPEYTMLGIGIL